MLSGVDVYRNEVWDIRLDCAIFWDELRASGQGQGVMADNRLCHNTFYNCGDLGLRLDDATNTLVANNVIALTENDAIAGNAVAASTITHNLYQFRHEWQEPVGMAAVAGDPAFVAPAAGDFRLQPGSPAMDRG